MYWAGWELANRSSHVTWVLVFGGIKAAELLLNRDVTEHADQVPPQ